MMKIADKRHRINASRKHIIIDNRLLDNTLITIMGIVFFFYILVFIRTFQFLPPIPSMGQHLPNYDPHDNVEFPSSSLLKEPLRIDELAKRMPFPIKIDEKTYETITHPAMELRHTKVEDDSTLSVPPYWKPTELEKYGGVRKYLGDYGRHLMTPEQAQTIGSFVTLNNDGTAAGASTITLETIFIAIASYRDFQCRQTIESAFIRAKYPQRLRIAVVDQYDHNASPNDDEPICSQTADPCSTHPNQILCKYAAQIDFYSMDAKLAVGPVFARHLGQRMYRGEYFAIQSDAHVDFVNDWDESIVEQWKSAKNEMAVLTAYLSDVNDHLDVESGERLVDTRPIMCKSDYEGFGKKKHLRHGQQPEGPAGIKGEPTVEPFWAAGFSFARGHFVVNVPYDQYLPMIFQGEEISLGLRGFTYGYDYYTPEKSICFHYYAKNDTSGKRKKVKQFWEHGSLYAGVEAKAMMRLNGIIGMNPKNIKPQDWIHDDQEFYGVGKVRKTEKFFETFGIDTKQQKTQDHLCKFAGKNMHHIWKQHLRKDRMGFDYDAIHYKFQDPDKFGPTWKEYLKSN